MSQPPSQAVPRSGRGDLRHRPRGVSAPATTPGPWRRPTRCSSRRPTTRCSTSSARPACSPWAATTRRPSRCTPCSRPGPDGDWTTLVGLYPNVEVYTRQLRALEAYCGETPPGGGGPVRPRRALHDAGRQRRRLGEAPRGRRAPAQGTRSRPSSSTSSPRRPRRLNKRRPRTTGPPADPVPRPGRARQRAAPCPTAPCRPRLVGAWTASPAQGVAITLKHRGREGLQLEGRRPRPAPRVQRRGHLRRRHPRPRPPPTSPRWSARSPGRTTPTSSSRPSAHRPTTPA